MPSPHSTPSDLAARFPWPSTPGASTPPRWTERGFAVDGRAVDVLSYMVSRSGWSDELTAMHEAEAGSGDHPIDLASRARAVAELRRHMGESGTIVEVGCSSGWLLSDMRAAFPRALVIGADYVAGPLRKLAKDHPDLPLVQLDLTRAPFPDGSVDAIVALNVLEHIEDDARAAAEMFRMLKPGGVAVIELPAGPGLYDVFDKALMHHRRYTRRSAVSLFERAGFVVQRTTHIGFFLYPPFVLVKLRNKRHLRKSEEEQQAIAASLIRESKASAALRWLMAAENLLGKAVSYPVGVRVAFSAVKPA
jgi:SAM-dependent methyltransferase